MQSPARPSWRSFVLRKSKPKIPTINAFLAVSRARALHAAGDIDRLAAEGSPLPPLAGVPIGVKDVLVMKGSPATAGSRILEGYQPPYDATVVNRLEVAGAVLVGKLNCDEFAMGSSNENSGYGPVRNPVALDRVPGGSSGGSAAAVAAGMAGRRARHRHWRISSPARLFLWSRRCPPNLRTCIALRLDRLCLLSRPRRSIDPHRARCSHSAGCDRGIMIRWMPLPPRYRYRIMSRLSISR